MPDNKQPIPFKLKLVRFKNSGFIRSIENVIYRLKPKKRLKIIPKKILFIKNDRIGDALLTIPVLRDLKLNYPDIEIHILISNVNAYFYDNIDYVDKIIRYDYDDFLGRITIFNRQKNGNDSLHRMLDKLYRVIIIGHLLQFTFVCLVPYLLKKSYRDELRKLRDEKYEAVIDLGGSKRLALTSRIIAPFTIGPKLFFLAWLYSYYLDTNWVSANENDVMTRKIEKAVTDALNLNLDKRDKSLPFSKNIEVKDYEKLYDIFFHLGTSELRKLSFEKEQKLIERLRNYKIIFTDSSNTDRFRYYKEKFTTAQKNDFTFKLYDNIVDSVEDASQSRLLICYDGGQTHLLSQFVKTITIFGPGSAQLWKPYEFEEYEELKTLNGVTKAIKSKGRFGHIAVYFPMWCNPCFDIGCDTRPCLNNIDINSLTKLIIETIGR